MPSTASEWAQYRNQKYGVPMPRVSCSLCWDQRVVRVDVPVGHEFFGKLLPCECATEEGRAARRKWIAVNCGLKGSELGGSLADWLLGQWPPDKARDLHAQRRAVETTLRRLFKEPVGFVTLWGDHGAGKSLALAIAVAEFVRRGIEAYFAEAPYILDHIRLLIQNNQDTSEFWRRLLTIPVLAVDEATRFHSTGWAQERIFVLVNERYRSQEHCLTLWATNDDPRQALPPSDSLGYLYSRMREGLTMQLQGDMRQAVGKSREVRF